MQVFVMCCASKAAELHLWHLSLCGGQICDRQGTATLALHWCKMLVVIFPTTAEIKIYTLGM